MKFNERLCVHAQPFIVLLGVRSGRWSRAWDISAHADRITRETLI